MDTREFINPERTSLLKKFKNLKNLFFNFNLFIYFKTYIYYLKNLIIYFFFFFKKFV